MSATSKVIPAAKSSLPDYIGSILSFGCTWNAITTRSVLSSARQSSLALCWLPFPVQLDIVPTLLFAFCLIKTVQTRTRTVYNSDGTSYTETYQEKVVTHRAWGNIKYDHWMDRSTSVCGLGMHRLVKMELSKSYEYEDDYTRDEFNRQRAKFKRDNDRDTYQAGINRLSNTCFAAVPAMTGCVACMVLGLTCASRGWATCCYDRTTGRTTSFKVTSSTPCVADMAKSLAFWVREATSSR